MLTTEQFDRARRLALRLAGIELHDRHRDLLHRRCCRAQVKNPAAFDDLLDAAEEGDPVASRRLVNLLTTNFTGFFRHPWHFDIAAEHALWAAHQRGAARIWCAAAATGEEPYSLGMALLEVFRRDDPPATILATDIDADVLDMAQRGEYGEPVLRVLPPDRRARFFGEAGVDGSRSIAPSVRRLVEFRALNLVDAAWPVQGPFDVIFCRNVLMYLQAGHRGAVLERMASLLAPNGLLLVDPAEHLGGAGAQFVPQADGIYQRRKTPPEPRARSRVIVAPNQRS